jgi:heme oxygenase (biliverdin-IX-beta and delta-forming)
MTILERLKDGTREVHRAIEAEVPILKPGAGEAEYRGYLARLLGFHRPLEGALRQVDGIEPLALALNLHWKTPLLERDLEALGGATAVPECPELPALPSKAAALGSLYVLEGATLGGQVIQRELAQRIPSTMETGAHYLRCYGTETGARWKAFTSMLLAHGDGAHDEVEMIAAAKETFSRLHEWLKGGQLQ